jgi:hypothetical protein
MIPCKVCLLKVEASPPLGAGERPKVSVTLNFIYYDEIQPLQTKYLCLSPHDVVGVEATIHGSEAMVGKVELKGAYRSALEGETVHIKVSSAPNSTPQSLQMTFLIEPVAALKRNKLAEGAENSKKADNSEEDPLRHQSRNHLEVSFSHRDPLTEENSVLNFTKECPPQREPLKDFPLFHDSSLFGEAVLSPP